MKILFDQGVPVPLRKTLINHTVVTAFELGWQTLRNGELIAAAEAQGFDLMITTDQNLRYQQNLSDRRIAILVLMTTRWPIIRASAGTVLQAAEATAPASYAELTFSPGDG